MCIGGKEGGGGGGGGSSVWDREKNERGKKRDTGRNRRIITLERDSERGK